MRHCQAASCHSEIPDDRKDRYCKTCRAAFAKKWRDENPEGWKAIQARSRITKKAKRASDPEYGAKVRAQQTAAAKRYVAKPEKAARQAEYRKQWARENREKKNAIHRARAARLKTEDPEKYRRWYANKTWAENHPAELKAYQKEYRKGHEEYFRGKNRAWIEAHRDEVNARARAYWARHRHAQITHTTKAKARRAGAPGSHTTVEWMACLERHGYRCAYCDGPLTPTTCTRDHAIPLSRGGSNDIENIVPACRRCNFSKRSRTPEEFRSFTEQKHRIAHCVNPSNLSEP